MSRFEEAIENDLKWREKELSSLKHFAIVSRNSSVAYTSALRAMWAMLYAHYEGFTKFCWESVLDEIQRKSIPRHRMQECVATLSLNDLFTKVRGDTSAEGLWRTFRVELPFYLNEATQFPSNSRLETKSNLSPKVFREQSQKLGILCKEIDRSEVEIKALVSRRNQIAHGETMTIRSLEEYQPYEDATILLMHELAVLSIDYLESGAYLKP